MESMTPCTLLHLSNCQCQISLLLLRIIASVIALALALGYGIDDLSNGRIDTAFTLLPLAAAAFLILRLDHEQLQERRCFGQR
ncbi:MAG: hypothetical protein PHO57_12105 [Acidithiobacillus sp.]|nr:hypothetical protein [Acidithiobacillus sp.]